MIGTFNSGLVSPTGASEECLNCDPRHPMTLAEVIMGTAPTNNPGGRTGYGNAFKVKKAGDGILGGVAVDLISIESVRPLRISIGGSIAADKRDHLIRAVSFGRYDTTDNMGRPRSGNRSISEIHEIIKANPALARPRFNFEHPPEHGKSQIPGIRSNPSSNLTRIQCHLVNRPAAVANT